MSIPNITITPQGIQAPTSQEVIAGLWGLFTDAFGADLNTAMSTPQGQLVTSLAAIITDERNQWIALMNQIDPRYSQGVWQDAIGYIYFMTRKQATKSVAQLTMIGLSGTVVPTGFQFADESGGVWQTTSVTTIPSDGQTKTDVECVADGPVEAAPETIVTIVKALSGLDRVFNEFAAIPGVNEESRTDFELRRKGAVALNSKNTDSATYGAVANIDDVVDVYVISNPTDETILVGSTNYPVIRNSILVSVVGGDCEAIASAILDKAGSGCSFNGNAEVIVSDAENFSSRPPNYTIKFLRPAQVPVYFQVEMEDRSMMSYQDEAAIKSAIINSLKTGNSKARIGQAVIASRFICTVASVTNLGIISIRVSRTASDYDDVVNIGVDEYPVTSQYQITII